MTARIAPRATLSTMKFNRTTGAVLLVALAALFGLAGWGQHLHMDPEVLSAVRTGAAAVFSLALALCGPLLRKDDDHDGIPDVVQRFLGLALGGVLVVAGCGGAQAALSTQARILAETQPARFEAYALLDARCRAEATFPAYRTCMDPARGVALASDSYRDALERAQVVLSAGGDASVAIACAAGAAARFAERLAAAGLAVPADVLSVAGLVGEGVCR